jgi:hypothetical protein
VFARVFRRFEARAQTQIGRGAHAAPPQGKEGENAMKAVVTVDGETRPLRPGETLALEPLPVALTATELREAAVELAGLLDSKANAAKEMHELLRTCRAAQAEKERDIERLTRLVAEGVETRAVPVATIRNEAAGTIRAVRQDTLAELWERPMLDDEKQGVLFEGVPDVLRPDLAKSPAPRRMRAKESA